MPKYRRNPFVSGTVTHESTGSLTGYGYIGKDIYGRFHNSPILYKTEREAKEALMKRKFKRNPAYRTQKNQEIYRTCRLRQKPVRKYSTAAEKRA